MKVGDYVRIADDRGTQFIGKIYNINDYREPTTKYAVDCQIFNDYAFVGDERIVNSSSNIIDLIEVGDYVNGKKVVSKQYHYTDEDNYDMGEWCIFYKNEALGDYQYDIKSIVTKECFESMEYKVGE